ncbi:MAG: hypothetical protein ABW223_12130 [Rariglobus sp.]
MKGKHLSIPELCEYRRLENVEDLKWSGAVVETIQRDVNRCGNSIATLPEFRPRFLTEG